MASITCFNTPELVALIASNIILSESSVAIYSTISRRWRSVIESRTFSTIYLNPSRLSDFVRIVKGARRGAVRQIQFDIVLDTYYQDVRGVFETPEEQKRNNEAFTKYMQELFGCLSTWSVDDVVQKGIELTLKAFSPSDPSCMSHSALMTRIQMSRESINGGDLLSRRFASSFLKLVPDIASNNGNGVLLPAVSFIRKLTIKDPGYDGQRKVRAFWPDSVFSIASSLPCLYEMDVILQDTEKKDITLRKRARENFAKSLGSLPASIRIFDLKYPYDPPSDQTFSAPDITTDGSDLCGASLRIFSHQLTSLTAKGLVLSSEFFVPSKLGIRAHDVAYWPHLTDLVIYYASVTPSGEWLFERDPAIEASDYTGEGRDLSEYLEKDELPTREYWKTDTFRHKPDVGLMNEFYMAAGLAVLGMPRIRNLSLVSDSFGQRHSLNFRVEDSKAILKLRSTPRFEPDKRVLDVWREAARKKTGLELNLLYLSDEQNQDAAVRHHMYKMLRVEMSYLDRRTF